MGRQFLAICRTVTEVRACEGATGNGEWPIWVGSSGLWGCLDTKQGRDVREAVGTFGFKKLTV